ncbi:MAG: phosphatidate cytidylyltransferase [Solirubrobacterales bacterium]|nr:phosphatidate cytidylyltransferase [Solirubrobacterales bacterium]
MSTPPRDRDRDRDRQRDRTRPPARPLDIPEKALVDTRSDLQARLIVAVPAVAVALTLVIAGGGIFAAGMFVLGAICLHELFLMFNGAHPSRLGALIGLAGLIVAAQLGDQSNVLMALVASFPVIFILILLQPKGGAPGVSVTVLGLTWIGLALAHAVLLRRLPHGEAILIDILVGTFIGDTGAYLGGRAIGRTKLAPRVSPNKTLEGLGCGIIAAVVAVWCAGLYQDWMSGTDALILGGAVAIMAPIGDLFESYLKRDAGTKDTGRLFGAHGGALDRLDAVMFTVVTGYYVWLALL